MPIAQRLFDSILQQILVFLFSKKDFESLEPMNSQEFKEILYYIDYYERT